MRQPFLIAAERDKLIEGLRKNHFLDVPFEYDAQAGAWVKRGYAGDAMRAAADAAIRQVEERAARAEAEERERAEAAAKAHAEAQARADAEAKARIEAEAAASRARRARRRGHSEPPTAIDARALEGHRGPVHGLAFAPGGRQLGARRTQDGARVGPRGGATTRWTSRGIRLP